MEKTEKAARRKKWRMRKSVSVVGCVLLVILLAGGGGAYALMRRGLPQVTGTLSLPGLMQEVKVTRDAEGVAHIAAQNYKDLFMAQGYVHAQDRLFQMDLSRRQASGRLSEVVGEVAIETDKVFRTLGLRRSAEASWPLYENTTSKEYLEAYAAGVNAYIEANKSKLPFEFLLNGYTPEPWSPIDSLTIGKYMSYDLAGNWESQAFRQYLLDTFSQEEAMELFPESVDVSGRPLIIEGGMSALNAEEETEAQTGGDIMLPADETFETENTVGANVASYFFNASLAKPEEWNGSNNWVISGARTASGQPILSNDPHLSIASPSVWYQNHLSAGELNVSGVIFAGAPGVIVGHNEHIAWGVTNTGPDVQDLYIEKMNPDNPHQYLYKDEWLDAQVVDESIRIKGGKVEPFEVLITRHGPILSDMATPNEENTAYALCWTALQPSMELQSVFNMNQATDWESFERALEDFHSPTQNFVFASTDGTIAYKANGLIPIRKSGDGLLPVPGWTDDYEWTGFIPFDELPSVVNPEAGYIASANYRVIGDEYPYHITHEWAQPYRMERIVEVLDSLTEVTAEQMQALQGDVVDLHAREIIPILLDGLIPVNERDQQVIDKLSAWDFETTADKTEPLLFNLWFSHIGDVIFENRFSEEAEGLMQGRNYIVDGLLRKEASGESSAWITNKGGLSTVLREALDRTLAQHDEIHKGKKGEWAVWGDFHKVEFTHPLSSVAVLKLIFNPEGAKPAPGTSTTVRAAAFRPTGLNHHGASWRMVRDFAQPDFAYHIVAPGISGHPLSPTYHKQFVPWIENEHYQTTLLEPEGQQLMLRP